MTFSEAQPFEDGLRLLADIGATNARFALESAPDRYWAVDVLPCEAYPSLDAAIEAFLRQHGQPPIRHAAVSIANPINGDWVQMTNHHWAFSIEALRRQLQLQTLLVVNDFTALAMSLPRLQASERIQIGSGQAQQGSVVGILGPGTGLGVSGLIPSQDRYLALGSEGGHVTYAPQDEDERIVVDFTQARFGHASGERMISGPGLELIYHALAKHHKHTPLTRTAAEISAAAQHGNDPVAHRALSVFCAMLGSIAGNLALTLGSRGGVYVGGGIVPQILEFFKASAFRQRFEAKGRFQPWLAQIPTFVITAPRPALRGVSMILSDHLSAEHGANRILDEVRSHLPRLTPAEHAVAQDVLSAPQSWMSDPIGLIAARAKVSTPTVLRFCRSLGYKGLADFKLRLGSGLSGSTRLTHSEVLAADPAADRVAKMLGNSISVLMGVRDRIDATQVEKISQLLCSAKRIELWGSGSTAVLAQDMHVKLTQLGLVAIARTDVALQKTSANFLGTSDAVLIFDHPAALGPSREVMTTLQKRGTPIIAITPNGSDLAKLADLPLLIDTARDTFAPIPLLLQTAQAALLDVLITSVALQLRDAQSGRESTPDDQRFGVIHHPVSPAMEP